MNTEISGFLGGLVTGLIILLFLQTPPSGDPFEGDQPAFRHQLERISANDLASLKMRHALLSDRFKVGIFGDSRAVQIGTSEIGMANGEFFNFSIPGTSIRQSVVLLEHLATAGKVPRIALISFDNAALQYFANPSWPGIPRRWREVFRDSWHGLRDPNITWHEWLHVGWRHLWVDWKLLKDLFNITLLKFRYGLTSEDKTIKPKFRKDGSRIEQDHSTWRIIEKLPVQRNAILQGYLTFDLARLAALRVKGAEVIVYESPMAKGSYDLTPTVVRTRTTMKNECKRLKLVCVFAPTLGVNHQPPYWQNSNHAPAKLLGPWLSKLIRERASTQL